VIGVFALGCGGGGGGGGVGSVLGAAIFIMAVSASGGAGAAAFAASIKERPIKPIFSDVSISANKIVVKITPMKSGAAYGTPVYITNPTVDSNKKLVGSVSMEVSTDQYLVEIVASGSTNSILSMEMAKTPTNGEIVPATVDFTSTAYNLTYNQWLNNSPADRSYANFMRILRITQHHLPP